MPRFPLRVGQALAAVCLLLGTPAAAATISGLQILDASTSAFDDAGGIGSVAGSSASVGASGATGFGVRYAAVVGADTGGSGGGSYTQTFSASLTITFAVTETAGTAWLVEVDVVRSGALAIVSDGTGIASVTLDALDVVHAGAGTLGGSLSLGAVGTLDNAAAPNTSPNQAFDQSSAAPLSGVGTGAPQTVTLVFTFTASASTLDTSGGQVQGDEAALRMGLDSALSSFRADNSALPTDGLFVTVAIPAAPLPEPAAEALLALGLIGLAWLDARRRR